MGEASFLTQRHVKLVQLYFFAMQLYFYLCQPDLERLD